MRKCNIRVVIIFFIHLHANHAGKKLENICVNKNLHVKNACLEKAAFQFNLVD